MTVEVNLVGMRCGAKQGGLSCTYCYQGAVREFSENRAPLKVDHAAIQASLRRTATKSEGFNLFGGEPLLGRVEDIRKVWEFGLAEYGRNGVQTSGRPITEELFQMFKDYKVHVGFSIDGPGDLNRARWAGSTAATLEATDVSIGWLKRCLAEGVGASVILTLTRFNASAARLPRLIEWFRELDGLGLRSARLHNLELDGPTKYIALSVDETEAALWAAYEFEQTSKNLKFDVFKDMLKLLRGDDDCVTCVWNACDPWTTPAVQGIDAAGHRALCQRVNKDGRQFVDAPRGPLVRQLVLASTEQKDGGCKGCRFLMHCKGQCYSDDTEVLTERGWALFRDLRPDDRLATRRDDGSLAYDAPTRFIAYPYAGEMLHFERKGLDLLVTPDHPMQVWSQRGEPLVKTGAGARGYSVRQTATWAGEETAWHEMTVPATMPGKEYRATNVRRVPMDAWLEVLGWYVSEGSASRGRQARGDIFSTALVTQRDRAVAERVAGLMRGMGFACDVNGNDDTVWKARNRSRQVYEELAPLGKAGDKHVPDYVKRLSPRQIRIFLSSLFAGDGSSRRAGRKRGGALRWENYGTVSRRLADDVQELLLKVGLASTVMKRADGPRGKTFGVRGEYSVVVRHGRARDGKETGITVPAPRRVPYDGVVYDVTMPASPTIFVRRNGRMVVAHNCPGTAIGGDWRKRSVDCELWVRLFSRLEAQLVAAGEEPTSLAPDRGILEERMARAWRAGQHASIHQCRLGEVVVPAGSSYHGDGHGDGHGDEHGDDHGDGHGDAHGDAHGDHTDYDRGAE